MNQKEIFGLHVDFNSDDSGTCVATYSGTIYATDCIEAFTNWKKVLIDKNIKK
ncbi:MAG: hypothetical protein H7A23_11990 [Leptospiraceae bacterium]|nr:hypothetical protein [Leptospiraceae bacterium]